MNYQIITYSDKGLKRTENQDYLGVLSISETGSFKKVFTSGQEINSNDFVFAIVADGVGSTKYGGMAAKIICESMINNSIYDLFNCDFNENEKSINKVELMIKKAENAYPQ